MPINFDDPDIKIFAVPTPEGPVNCVVRLVGSSNVKWVGWPETPAQTPLMFVEFMDGSRYVYFGVTRQRAVWCAFAESTGSYLNKKIKGKYEVLKLR
jgi:hypothetical protein